MSHLSPCQLRHSVPLRYCALFASPMRYSRKIWGKNYNSHRDLKQSTCLNLRVTLKVYANSLEIMKFKDIVTLKNCIFALNQTNANWSSTFENYFCKKKDQLPIKNRSRYGWITIWFKLFLMYVCMCVYVPSCICEWMHTFSNKFSRQEIFVEGVFTRSNFWKFGTNS